MWHIVIVDGALQVIKQYVAITAYGFTLSAEAVGWTPNSFSFFLPSLLLLCSLRLQVMFIPLLSFPSFPSSVERNAVRHPNFTSILSRNFKDGKFCSFVHDPCAAVR